MQIKQPALEKHLQQKIAPIYLLIGQDNYLIQEAQHTIKTAIQKKYTAEIKKFSIQTPEQWVDVLHEANSYSLFSDQVILDLSLEKKTLDAEGKHFFSDYLKSINTRCFIILQAPNLQIKPLQWLSSHDQVVIVLSFPLDPETMKNWIAHQLKKHLFLYEPEVPHLIYQYTQGNMLASAQAIEKITLTQPNSIPLNAKSVLEHLSDQSEHSLYELVNAILSGLPELAIQILRKSAQNKTEPAFVLWILSHEIRRLFQLSNVSQKPIEFKATCAELKIWPNQSLLYQKSLKRFNHQFLSSLLHFCYLIDEQIKTNHTNTTWYSLENIVLSLCMGKLIGDVCSV